MLRITVILTAAVLLTGCSVDYKAEVDSDTTWSGAFGNRTVDGSGKTTVDLPDDDPVCCTVQKMTESGRLRVRVVADGGGILGPSDSDWVETTASYGVVTACSEE
ncbi:hypothetical protein GF314_03835 [bacterium]|jgi:hypothetical protein|nr:hypothetical protein [bacterium]